MRKRGAQDRVETWPPKATTARGFATLDVSAAAWFIPWLDLLRQWLAAEFAPGRLIPWLPVAFATGIILYFAAEHEPFWWAGLTLAGMLAVLTIAFRASAAFPVLLGLTAIAAGFSVATLRTVMVSHPVLTVPLFNAQLTGFVETREERERSDRIVLRVHDITAEKLTIKPERVRLSVKKGTGPLVGDFVALRARLNPPLQPLRPGGYDFARDLYFQRIGASGFAQGAIRQSAPPHAPGIALRAISAIGFLREGIDDRIRAVLPGDKGAIASALITGKRDAISASINDAMFVSSLGHVLSISGYHMAVVAGVVFFTLRALFALVPAFACRYPIKKWAAGAALVATAFYLLLSGAEVATRRSFIMTAIVLIGVMFDRPALTLRTIAVAAFAVLLTTPEAVVHPSFQMSFAATLALIAAYERGLPWLSAAPKTPYAARIVLWGGREIIGLVVVSLVAGAASTLYAAYHFHRLAPYGLIANLLAMPIVSVWVMPTGLLGLIAIPFGFDAVFWRMMGAGVEWMMIVAQWVANLPGAVGQISAFGTGALLIASLGLVTLCLLRTPLRWGGVLLIGLGLLAAWRAPLPDILVSQDARMVAVRNPDGRLSVMKTGQDDFTLREWLAADGDARSPRDPSLTEHVRCDGSGCTLPLHGGDVVALASSAEAVMEDCARAILVVTPRKALDCRAHIIDRDLLRRHGAAALMRTEKEEQDFAVTFARPPGQERPWIPAAMRTSSGSMASSSLSVPSAARNARTRVAPAVPQSARDTSTAQEDPEAETIETEDLSGGE
jgi:competence protein ComEC